MGVSLGGNGVSVYGKEKALVPSGQKTVTVAGTAEQMSTSTAEITGVYIRALDDNTGNLYIGDSTIDSTGFYLTATDSAIFIPVGQLSYIWLDVAVSGEGAAFLPV